MKNVLLFLIIAFSLLMAADSKKHLGITSYLQQLAVAKANYSKVVRVGLLARDGKHLNDQGFVVRKDQVMGMVDSKIHNDILFQVTIYHCNRHNNQGE
jgi:hypothetical protein